MLARRSVPLALCVLAGLSLACATARPPASPAHPESPASAAEVTGLSFTVEPADAEVVIDGHSAGAVAGLPRGGVVPLPPGLYQVSLRRAGYSTWRAEVAVRSGVEPIRVTLSHR
jgi:hypothetical protein